MVSPLSGQLASIIYTGMKALFLDATLSRDTVATGSPDVSFDPPDPTVTTYSCKAVPERRKTKTFADGSLIITGNYKVLILANSLSVEPVPGDRVTVSGVTFTICADGVDIDPAGAVWVCVGVK